MHSKNLRVAVIGAGASGLAAIKCCLDEELETTCFEKSDGIAGLWRFTEKAETGRAGVYSTTVINSSKELLAYSTFPPPADFPNFMHHTKLFQYMSLFADKYELRRHILFNTEVLSVSKAANFDVTSRWVVAFKKAGMKDAETDTFDAVLVCTGHHAYPNNPSPDIPGLGNTGGDLAAELSRHASKLFLSTRRGAWLINRIAYKGRPYDCSLVTRLIHYFLKISPSFLSNAGFEFLMNTRVDHELYGIKPNHHIMSQHPLVNDELPARIANGSVIVVPDIKSFRKSGVVMSDGEFHEVDDVIFATGYKIRFPFLPSSVVSVDDRNQLSMLYKHVFPVSLSDNPSLAIIGNVQPLGGLMPIAEMQSRWAARVFKKLVNLPPHHAMRREVETRRLALRKRFVNSSRHTIQVDYVDYMDTVASEIGVKPNLLHLLISDPKMAWQVLTGPGSSYQYRLYGPGKWEGARQAIDTQWSRIAAGYGGGLHQKRSRFRKQCAHTPVSEKQSVIIGSLISLFVFLFYCSYTLLCL